MSEEKFIVGWREWIRLPDLHIRNIKAKVDTGARTSALHAEDVEVVGRGDRRVVHFSIYPRQRSRQRAIRAIAPLVSERVVRSSNGQQEIRPVIATHVDIGGHLWLIELTLTRRDMMGFRMLLGRQAIRGHALVDAGRSFVTRKVKLKKVSKLAAKHR